MVSFKRFCQLAAVGMLVIAGTVCAQQRPLAFVNARLLPISSAPIEAGSLLIQDGKIRAIGRDIAIPANAERRDMAGAVIMPGLVDTHSHIGQVAGADGSAAIQPDVRALDSINVRHAGIGKARAGGVTTANVMPGSGHLLSGQTLYLKLRHANTIEDLSIHLPDGSIAGGIKMANGTNPMRGDPGFPGTRGKSAAMLRSALLAGQEYCSKPPKVRDLGKEGLCDILQGRRVVHFHSHRHDDIITVLRLAREFKLRVVIQHGTDAYLVAEEIAAAGVPVSAIVLDSPGGKLEVMNFSMQSGAILERHGILTAFHTDDPITDSRLLLRSAALAVRNGMSREGALRALTLNAARMLDLEQRIGSLEVGKDADLLVLDGDPLSVYSKVQQTWVEGQLLFDRKRPADVLLAEGGWGGGHDKVANDVIMMEGGE